MGSYFGGRSVFLLLIALTIIQGIRAIQYSVICSGLGESRVRFRKEVGDAVAISIMKRATDFVWEEVLQQSSSDERKDVQKIHLVIGAPWGQEAATSHYQSTNTIYLLHLNPQTIRSCPAGQLEKVITAPIYFEIARILQWRSDDENMMTNSIAYFATLEAEYQTSNMVAFGEGDKWDQSAQVTAQFLVYCNDRKSRFVAFLNYMCKSHFRESYFEEYFDENIDDLWKDYKNKYGVKA